MYFEHIHPSLSPNPTPTRSTPNSRPTQLPGFFSPLSRLFLTIPDSFLLMHTSFPYVLCIGCALLQKVPAYPKTQKVLNPV